MNNSYEHFATKGIQRNLRASRELEDPSSYYPITTYTNDSYRGSHSLLAVFFAGVVLGAVAMLFLSGF
jgi:hypothetical protein